MNSTIDIHQVFADYFKQDIIKPIAYECSRKLSEGHICLDIDEYNSGHELQVDSKDLLSKSRWITDNPDKVNAFILNNNKVYMHRYFAYETEIVRAIRKLIENEEISVKLILLLEQKYLIQSIFEEQEGSVNWQLIAALQSYLHNFSIITGGPGTGKTTTIAKFLALVFSINPKIKVALAAPTGKAAARIKESILQAKSEIKGLSQEIKTHFDRLESSTIHRLLGYKRGTHYFKHNADNPLNYDIVIVDESSMIGVSLMSKLISAIPTDKQIILLGDKDQLASVEAGSVFGDICQSQSKMNLFPQNALDILNQFLKSKLSEENLCQTEYLLSAHMVELQNSYRFARDKGIGKISYAVLDSCLESKNIDAYNNNDQVKIFEDYRAKDFEAFYELYQQYIAEKDPLHALKNFSNIRLLSPIHKGEFSVEYFNQKVEDYLKLKGFLFPKYGFYHNQPIMITQNDYHLKLFNGDIGLVRADENNELQVYFESEDGSLRAINPNFINQYQTVFSMTIHKSQGSEFEHVAVVLPRQEGLSILTKELLYTGLTRAKLDLWIFAKANILEETSKKPVQRASGITERIKL